MFLFPIPITDSLMTNLRRAKRPPSDYWYSDRVCKRRLSPTDSFSLPIATHPYFAARSVG